MCVLSVFGAEFQPHNIYTKTITIVIIIIVPHHKLLQKIIENYTFKMRKFGNALKISKLKPIPLMSNVND